MYNAAAGRTLNVLEMSLDPHPPPVPRVLEVHEVAYSLKCSQETVRRLIREQKLIAFRLGAHWRVDADELKAFIVRQRATGGQNGNGEGG